MYLRTSPSTSRRRRGAVVILFAILLTLVLAFVALSVDLGYVCSVKADLQTAADAASLAGTSVLLENERKAVKVAEQFANLNLNNQGVRTVGKQVIEVELGHWDFDDREFKPGKRPLDAVLVNTRVVNSSLFFARVLGSKKFVSEAKAIATVRPRDIMLVLDVSGSMSQTRNNVAKIHELRESVRSFLKYLGEVDADDRVGFTYYSTTASLGSKLSSDRSGVEAALMKRLQPEGWTNIADGMQIGLTELTNRSRDHAAPLMILLTDGAANLNQPGDWYDPDEAKRRVIQQAEAARQRKIPILTIALDSENVEVDVDLMRRVSAITESEAFHIIAGETAYNGTSSLHETFRKVAYNRPIRIVD